MCRICGRLNRELAIKYKLFGRIEKYLLDLGAPRVHSVLVVQLFDCVLQGLLLDQRAVNTVAHSAYAAVAAKIYNKINLLVKDFPEFLLLTCGSCGW